MLGLRRHASSIMIALALVMTVVMVVGRTARRSRAARTRVASDAAPQTQPQPQPNPQTQPAAPAASATSAPKIQPRTSAQPAQPASAENAQNVVAQQMRTTDAADRTLLVAFERAGAKWPEPVARELIAAQRQGASVAELEQLIGSRLAGNLPAQMAARRWLREKNGDQATAPAKPSATTIGNGGGPRSVTDVQRAKQK